MCSLSYLLLLSNIAFQPQSLEMYLYGNDCHNIDNYILYRILYRESHE